MPTALLSVSDKTGLLPFAKQLEELGFRLLSSGGTAKALSDGGVVVETVEAYTGSPEVMGGRVKTLHPRVHGGILSRGPVDAADLARLGGREIDLVVVNLYPFEQVRARDGATHEEIIENIDIGGPSMVRRAAKNHARVAVVCDPADYDAVLSELRAHGSVEPATRARLAAKAFAHTAAYDGAIAGYLSSASASEYPRHLSLHFDRGYGLRYGENPHQSAAFYIERNALPGTLATAQSLGAGGKELSFNNFVDADAALACVREFDECAAVVVKHTNPCGVATASAPATAYKRARDADALSAFGGIVAFNRPVDEQTAALLAETFLECVVAPAFSDGAIARLREKKNLRLLAVGGDRLAPLRSSRVVKAIGGGLLVQDRDATAAGEVRKGRVATQRAPSDAELAALEFAWRVSKHVKSNAIVLARGAGHGSTDAGSPEPGHVTVGIGAGQMSRLVSVQIACEKAQGAARGAVLASDAFFPFPDGLVQAATHGVVAVAQPGGSVKDADVIHAADAHGMAMVMTGVRHFFH
jgi:phosphoribosylaminoimidazolecarboxamide formyltransferase/IMP cyclohydrolase